MDQRSWAAGGTRRPRGIMRGRPCARPGSQRHAARAVRGASFTRLSNSSSTARRSESVEARPGDIRAGSWRTPTRSVGVLVAQPGA